MTRLRTAPNAGGNRNHAPAGQAPGMTRLRTDRTPAADATGPRPIRSPA